MPSKVLARRAWLYRRIPRLKKARTAIAVQDGRFACAWGAKRATHALGPQRRRKARNLAKPSVLASYGSLARPSGVPLSFRIWSLARPSGVPLSSSLSLSLGVQLAITPFLPPPSSGFSIEPFQV